MAAGARVVLGDQMRDIDYLRNRAEECRTVAEQFAEPDLRRQMLIMADLFDNLAVQAELLSTPSAISTALLN